MVKSFYVCITREVDVQSDSAGKETLSRSDEEEFERILIEAVKRVVSAIKRMTEQPSIDTRRPVHGYRYSYRKDDGTVIKESPLKPGTYAMPNYSPYGLAGIYTPFKPPEELDAAMWADTQGDVHDEVDVPLHRELIYDAVTLQVAMKFEMAALCAAVAAEIMLYKLCSILLRRKGLQDEQIKTLLGGRNNPQLAGIIKKLDPNVRLPDLDTVIKERNAIAHGRSQDEEYRNIEPERMAEIINTAYAVRQVLDDYEWLSEEGG